MQSSPQLPSELNQAHCTLWLSAYGCAQAHRQPLPSADGHVCRPLPACAALGLSRSDATMTTTATSPARSLRMLFSLIVVRRDRPAAAPPPWAGSAAGLRPLEAGDLVVDPRLVAVEPRAVVEPPVVEVVPVLTGADAR